MGLVLLLSARVLLAADSQRWISDQLEVDMRRGQGNRYAITRMVPSGTAVELLQVDAGSGYSRVRTPSGAEGWVLSRYLMDQPPARMRVPALEGQVSVLKQDQANISGKLQATGRERDELRQKVSSLEANGKNMEQQLAEARSLSSDTAKIADQNHALTAKLAEAEQRVADLESRNRALSDRGRRDWFIAGAGVLGAGMTLGLILPRIRWKKKDSWSRL